MIKILAFVGFVSLLIISCPQKKPDKDILRIGTDATYPPFETIDAKTGEIVGFDIDLMRELCKELKKEPEFIVVPFDGIIAGLKQKKYDAIISAMTITEERAKEVSFTKPYYLAGQSIVVHKEDTEIKGPDDLKGKKIGVQLGTTGEMLAKKIPDAKIISYDHITAAFISLENRDIDAIINDAPTNRAIIKKKDKLKIVGDLLTKEYYGIAVRKDDKELLDSLNAALEKLKKTGKLNQLYKKWNLEGGEVEWE